MKIIFAISAFSKDSILLKFIKFGLVGFIGLIVDFGVTWLCKEKLGLQKYLSNSIGFLVAASSNYYLNRIWTFYSQEPEILMQYGKFLLISTIGLALNNWLLFYFHDKKKVDFYMAKLFAIALVIFWNFFANYFYTF